MRADTKNRIRAGRKGFVRAAAVLLAVLLTAAGGALCAEAASTSQQVTEHTYDIAVAFDNSGSMYWDDRWSKAKYAMEIFASMLDLDGGADRLEIFPMWEVQTVENPEPPAAGAGFRPQKATKPIEIRKAADIELIHRMYTPLAGGTPFDAVENAYAYLQKSSASDKWLIVLTDGEFQDMESAELEKRLKQYSSETVKVQYLCINMENQLKSDASDYFYAAGGEDVDVSSELVEICNRIFQRNRFEDGIDRDGKLTFDLSMSKIIVFVQGEGAEITGLTGPDGAAKISAKGKQVTPSAAKHAAGDDGNPGDLFIQVAQDLYGQVVIFEDCKAGEYQLQYRGDRELVQIFYEPDVKIVFRFTTDSGETVLFSDPQSAEQTITPGEYVFHCELVDGQTGKTVGSSALLGKTEILGYLIQDGKRTSYQDGGKITFEDKTDLEFLVEGTYLDGKYRISTKDSIGTLRFHVENPVPPAPVIGLEISSEQPGNWYSTMERGKWREVYISVTVDGKPATDEQLEALALDFRYDSGFSFSEPRIDPGRSRFIVEPFQNAENRGFFKKEECVLSASASYTDPETEQTGTAEAKPLSLTIAGMPYAVHVTFVLIIILLTLLLIGLIFLILKKTSCFPKRVRIRVFKEPDTRKAQFEIPLRLNEGGSVEISNATKSGVSYLTAEAHKLPKSAVNLLNRRKPHAGFALIKVVPSPKVVTIRLNGVEYERNGSQWSRKGSSGKAVNLAEVRVQVTNGTNVRYSVNENGRIASYRTVFEINSR